VQRRSTRALLLVLVPALVVAAALFAYLHSGRYVSTDNAYVKAHIANLAAEVPGTIAEVLVSENEHVPAGEVLFRLNDEPFRIALAGAEATLAQAASDVRADKLAHQRALAEIELHQTTATFARAQLKRQEGLRAADLGTIEALDSASYALESAERQIDVARDEAAVLLARLNGDAQAPVELHPKYQAANAALAQARLDLDHTEVRAPFAGTVTQRPEPGDYVERGMPVMAVVSDEGLWIEANFKETQLAHIQPGQSVEIEIDSYPSQRWQGQVESIRDATGAEFALLPPQNASGNWVKVVQRIPVRIAVERHEGQPPLRAGMSSTVIVDTGHQRSWRDLLPTF
jgi:membrane fusion protein (multidrug efflux system)